MADETSVKAQAANIPSGEPTFLPIPETIIRFLPAVPPPLAVRQPGD